MHALILDRFGAPEVLKYKKIADPVVSSGQARVCMEAIGLNFADVNRRRSKYPLYGEASWILGYEGVGVIEKLEAGQDGDLWNVVTDARERRARQGALRSCCSWPSPDANCGHFPASEGAIAHRFLESRAAVAKVLLVPAQAMLKQKLEI